MFPGIPSPIVVDDIVYIMKSGTGVLLRVRRGER